ncbi:MAG: DUF4142 domain-containing protein [Rhodospirillales bacterium]|nr:DUF4142 domain-containing protein [Rhodospirillales bacterium]
MKTMIAAACAIGLVVALSGVQANAAEDPADFVKTAIRGNIAEIQMGELAEKKAKNPRVQELGKTLVNDHQKAKAQSVELAKDMKIDPPTKPTEDAKETHDLLAKLSGEKFDEEFVEVAVKDHKKDIDLYSEQIEDGRNKKVVEYARKTLPVLEKHLAFAQKLEGKVSN